MCLGHACYIDIAIDGTVHVNDLGHESRQMREATQVRSCRQLGAVGTATGRSEGRAFQGLATAGDGDLEVRGAGGVGGPLQW